MTRLASLTTYFIAYSLCVGATAKPKPAETVRILAVSNRYLELEPCGCSDKPIGGVEREKNFIQSLPQSVRKRTLSVTTGTSFVPQPLSYVASRTKQYEAQSLYLIESLNRLGVSALAPSIEDFSLGSPVIKNLAEKARFPFVSANIRHKSTKTRVFPAFVRMDKGPIPIFIIGLSGQVAIGYPTPSDVEVESPLAALESVLREIPTGPRLVVVLSSLLSSEHQEILQRAPGVHVILGGRSNEAAEEFRQPTPTLVVANPEKQGRAVAVLKLSLQNRAVEGFYSNHEARNTRKARLSWQNRVLELERLLTEDPTRSDRAELQKEIETIEQRIALTNLIPLNPYEDTTHYEGEIVVLSSKFEKPSNDVGEVVRQMKEEIAKAKR